MIFDGEAITELVIKWQNDQDPATLDNIVNGCTKLIEAIVSMYDSFYRDELIQESYLKVVTSIHYYNPSVSSLHNYLTTVIRNNCISYLKKQVKYQREVEIDHLLNRDGQPFSSGEDEEFQALICRNRERFPSIPVKTLDDVTELIYQSLLAGDNGRVIIANLFETGMTRHMSTILYNSMVVYLRLSNPLSAKKADGIYEFSMLPEIREVIGDKAYRKFITIFSGMYIRIP